MDNNEVQQWSNTLDIAEQSPLTANLPNDAPVGLIIDDTAVDGINRLWKRVEVIAGSSGSRWAYWAPWKDASKRIGIGPHPENKVIADRIFNGDAAHFAGMLGRPFSGSIPGEIQHSWLLLSPKPAPPQVETILIEKPQVRYEKSKEVYNLDEHTVDEIQR